MNKEWERLLEVLTSQFNAGAGVNHADLIRAKIELEIADAQIRAAVANEKNARYMLWSVVAASSVVSLASTILTILWHS
jgi:outer membrane protein TolC